MAKSKAKVPKRIAGIRIRKKQRKRLKAILRHVENLDQLVTLGSALVALVSAAAARRKSPAA